MSKGRPGSQEHEGNLERSDYCRERRHRDRRGQLLLSPVLDQTRLSPREYHTYNLSLERRSQLLRPHCRRCGQSRCGLVLPLRQRQPRSRLPTASPSGKASRSSSERRFLVPLVAQGRVQFFFTFPSPPLEGERVRVRGAFPTNEKGHVWGGL